MVELPETFSDYLLGIRHCLSLLLLTIPFEIGVKACNFKIFAVFATGTLSTTFCLSMSAWLAGMVDPMLLPRPDGSDRRRCLVRPRQPWNRNFRRKGDSFGGTRDSRYLERSAWRWRMLSRRQARCRRFDYCQRIGNGFALCAMAPLGRRGVPPLISHVLYQLCLPLACS